MPQQTAAARESQDQRFSPPAVSLPKGGGAIRSIGEKFAANPVNGTGATTVPIVLSPGRSGFGPQLNLTYDSGAGNGVFGFGWNLSLPAITRKTDKGLPQYRDAQESDVFVLSGAEDLVPVFKKDSNGNYLRNAAGNLLVDEIQRDGFQVRRYRPRLEGLFARIERWTRESDGDTQRAVRSRYGSIALSDLSSQQDAVRQVAEAFGYTPEELASIPAEANMGLSCGNPTALANLREGETVVDLGSGGGLDVFLAAAKVGLTGRAIGIDMTPKMVERARRNAERGNNGKPLTNVEFHLATIDKLPLPDNSVDCVISNCVINLAPDKTAVFREMARVLKPGGRVAISDIALKRELPSEIASDVAAYTGCIAGAILIADYKQGLLEAGFSHVEVVDSAADLKRICQTGKSIGLLFTVGGNRL